jgi:hypothetical protein
MRRAAPMWPTGMLPGRQLGHRPLRQGFGAEPVNVAGRAGRTRAQRLAVFVGRPVRWSRTVGRITVATLARYAGATASGGWHPALRVDATARCAITVSSASDLTRAEQTERAALAFAVGIAQRRRFACSVVDAEEAPHELTRCAGYAWPVRRATEIPGGCSLRGQQQTGEERDDCRGVPETSVHGDLPVSRCCRV